MNRKRNAHTAPDYREHVEDLVRRLGETEGAIQALGAGQVDAIVDPATAAPILLSRAQAALARSEARFRNLVARAPAIVVELAQDGSVLFVNAAVEALLGYAPDELQGRNWWSHSVTCEGGPLAETMARETLRSDVSGCELPHRTARGEIRWIAWNSASQQARDGCPPTLLLFGVDVTDRRRAEETARRMAEAEVARARAEAANHAKAEFLAMMSHDLRTPLNAILGYTDLMYLGVRGPVTAQQTEDLERIRRSALHLLGLINDILSFAKADAGQVSFACADVSVHDVLETVTLLTAPQVKEKGLAYQVLECAPSFTVRSDGEKLQQILTNLVTNAIKFTPPGGRIWVECRLHRDGVLVHVNDTGPGISPDRLDAIFEPFVQLERGPGNSRMGVGLGLAISRKLARAMGGDLTVASVPGKGSSFTLRIAHAPAGEPPAGAPG